MLWAFFSFFFFFNDTATTEIYTLSLHDALPICPSPDGWRHGAWSIRAPTRRRRHRSEEHTSELQSPCNLVCRLLLEKKKNTCITIQIITHITVPYHVLTISPPSIALQAHSTNTI